MRFKETAEMVANYVPYLKISRSLPDSDTVLPSQNTVIKPESQA